MAKRRRKLDAFDWHEALDRSLLAFEFFNENVASHHAVVSDEKFKRDAEAIAQRMFQLYQDIASATPGEK
jgi:hypothetical protein